MEWALNQLPVPVARMLDPLSLVWKMEVALFVVLFYLAGIDPSLPIQLQPPWMRNILIISGICSLLLSGS